MELSFDPAHPPEEPPDEVARPMLWRLAVRLLAAHRPQWMAAPWQPRPPCVTCLDPWPCRGHRLGERGLLASLRTPELEDDPPCAGS